MHGFCDLKIFVWVHLKSRQLLGNESPDRPDEGYLREHVATFMAEPHKCRLRLDSMVF